VSDFSTILQAVSLLDKVRFALLQEVTLPTHFTWSAGPRALEEMLYLHHFTNPIWFDQKGGFERDDSPEILARFTSKVVERLGSKVRLWSTINEPNIYAVEGYYRGTFPPGLRDSGRAIVVFRNLLRAHTACYRVIKNLRPDAQIGLLANIFVFVSPQPWNLLDVMLAHFLNNAFSVSVVDYLTTGVFDFSIPGVGSGHYDSGVPEAFDFVGLNYYSRLLYHVDPFTEEKMVEVHRLPREELTDKGWENYPEGLYRALRMISSRTAKPIFITENGIADDSLPKGIPVPQAKPLVLRSRRWTCVTRSALLNSTGRYTASHEPTRIVETTGDNVCRRTAGSFPSVWEVRAHDCRDR